jgi:hypothetical protein
LPTFNRTGDDVWKAWDAFLGDSTGTHLYLQSSGIVIDDHPKAADQTATVAGLVDKSVPWQLKSDHDGLPILPSSEGLQLPDIKQIIRSFITLHYRELITCSMSLL